MMDYVFICLLGKYDWVYNMKGATLTYVPNKLMFGSQNSRSDMRIFLRISDPNRIWHPPGFFQEHTLVAPLEKASLQKGAFSFKDILKEVLLLGCG